MIGTISPEAETVLKSLRASSPLSASPERFECLLSPRRIARAEVTLAVTSVEGS